MIHRVVAFDTETCLIRPGRQAPELVCMTWQEAKFNKEFGQFMPLEEPSIVHHTDSVCYDEFLDWLMDDACMIVGHNVAYDMAVKCARFPGLINLVFAKYEKNLVTDTMIRQQLLDIAAGNYRIELVDNRWIKRGYSLDDCVHRVRGARLKKDGWRLAYNFFLDTLLDQWDERAVEVQTIARGWLAHAVYNPKTKETTGPWPNELGVKDVQAIVDDEPGGARLYPLEDARATLDVYLWQDVHDEDMRDQFRQAKYAFALHLSSVYGLRTTPRGVEQFEAITIQEYEEAKADLIQVGLVRPNGTRDMKAAAAAVTAACERLEIPLVLTDGGKPALDKDTCDAIDDNVIKLYSEFQTLSKVLSNDVPMLRSGVQTPIHPRYGLADTGRSTCTGPNIQALRRKKGIREAFVPRDGYVFAQADYEGLELHTLAQVCYSIIGYSNLGDAIKLGQDPHLQVAARILEIDYNTALKRKKDKKDEELQNARQAGKVCNFGFPVGLGAESLVHYARKTYGVALTKEQAKMLKRVWLEQWPEMQEYFSYINQIMGPEKRCRIEQLFTKRIRSTDRFTSACSTYSQGLGGDCAKNAVWLVARAQYTDRTSPLFGTRTIAFVHDEIIAEVPDNDKAHDAAQELGKLMLQGANEFLPSCPARIEPMLMDCWSKSAAPLYDDNKRLRVWRLAENG